jgi:cellulose synthase operon protein C
MAEMRPALNIPTQLRPMIRQIGRPAAAALLAGILMTAADLTTPALAQDSLAPGMNDNVGDGAGARISAEDMFALRYYLENEQYDRVEAEIRRLRAIDPSWDVPDDILTRSFGPDEAAVWTALADGNTDRARQELERLQQEFPDYTPSQELSIEMRRVSSQQLLRDAISAGDWSGAVSAAEGAPEIITCGRLDNVWSLGEAYARLDRPGDAASVWRQAIDLCGRYDIAEATIEKADAFLPQQALDDLIEAAIASIGRQSDFEALRNRLAAGREAGVGGPDAVIAGEPSPDEDTASAPVSAPAPVSTPAPAPAPASAPASSEIAAAPSPPQALTQPAAESAAPSLSSSVDLQVASSASERRDYARCLAATQGAASASALLVRGWCLYEMDRPTEAQLAFAAVQEQTTDPQERIDSQFGELLAMLRRQLVDEAERRLVQASLPEEYEIDVSAEILAQKAVLAYEAGQNQRALVLIDARSSMAPDRRDLSMIEGFALYNLGRIAEAGRVFQRLDLQLSTPESREGLRIVHSSRQ